MMQPGWIRAAWMTVAGAAFAFGLVVGIRALYGVVRARGRAARHRDPDRRAARVPGRASAASTTGAGTSSARPRSPTTTPTTARAAGRTTSSVNTDHKVIGVQYTVTALFFMFVGGALAEVIRAELAQPGQQVVDPNTYNGLFSVHASLMIFLVVIPIFAGLANFVLPLMIGAPDMAFPRLNALSYWLLPVAGVMMVVELPRSGRRARSTRAGRPTRRYRTNAPLGQQFFTIGVQFAGTSSIMTALNFIVTIITMRAPGMTFWRMPLLVWANFTTSLLVVIATPFVAGSQFLRAARPHAARELLRPVAGRRRDLLPAHLLVLLAPGGLHHDAARVRDHLGGHLDQGAQADLRLPPDGAVADGDPRARLHRLGAPHVRVGHVDAGCACR